MATSTMAGESIKLLIMAGLMGLLAAVFLPVLTTQVLGVSTGSWTPIAGTAWELLPLGAVAAVFIALLVAAVGVFG